MSVAIPIPLLQHLPDVNVTPAVGVDENMLVYDHDTARFVLRAPFDGTPYALLAGRAGGTTIYGGTAANDDITIHGTSNATRTTSYVLLQPSGGNVGIGTASPATALHVAGAATVTGGIRPAADSTTALQLQNVAGTSVLNVDTTNSRVGIGTTGPLTNLHIVGFNCALGLSGETNTNDAEIASIKFSNLYHGTLDNPVAKIVARNLATYDDGDYALSFHTRVLGTLTEKVRIDNIGNVGIGNVAPAEKLDVTGNANVTGVYKVDDVQVLSNRVIDARCADVANSGDATTDGLIDALRDALVAHGLIAAA